MAVRTSEQETACTSRRRALATLGQVGVAALLSPAQLLPSVSRAATPRRGAIDVHHHFRLAELGGVVPDDGWTPARSLEQMDRFGIATSILSTPISYALFTGDEKSRGLVRRCNDFMTQLRNDHRERFGFFGLLPLPDVDRSLREIEYVFDTLHADGVGMFSNANDIWLGDPVLDPVFAELNRRKAVVFIHPIVGSCCRNLVRNVRDQTLEFDFDTTRTVTSLLANGTLARHPDVRIIVNHSGAAIPILAGRIGGHLPGRTDNYPQGTDHELKKLYYEIAHATYPAPLSALTKYVATSQILFGTDYPFEPVETTVDELPVSGLSRRELETVQITNAERLFPRFKR